MWGWERQLWKLWGPETGQRQGEAVPVSSPATYPQVCTWHPSTKARVSRVDRFHFHQGLTDNRQDETFSSDFTADVWRLSHLVYERQAQETWVKWETVGRSLRRVTRSLIFLQDRRTQETVICQTLQQNKTGLLLIQTKAHSCRKVSARNLSPPWSFCRFVITFPGFFFQCFFPLTICFLSCRYVTFYWVPPVCMCELAP